MKGGRGGPRREEKGEKSRHYAGMRKEIHGRKRGPKASHPREEIIINNKKKKQQKGGEKNRDSSPWNGWGL